MITLFCASIVPFIDKIDETEKKLKEENKAAFISQTTIWKH